MGGGPRWCSGGLLVGFAGLAALVLRDEVAVRTATQRGTGAVVRQCVGQCVEMVRLASGTSLSVLYALALGGVVAIAVYLPVYLAAVFGLEWFDALAVTGAVVGLTAVARLVGGWWTDRRPTARLLTVCYAVAASLGESDTRWGAVPIVARLAELAASDELVVVYGSDEPQLPRLDANVLLVGLRDRLPRHSVVALRVGRETGGRLAGLFGEFV